MVKRGKNQKQMHWNAMNSKSKKVQDVDMNDMDDEIDAFHKKKDMIPLDIDADSGDSDEDVEQSVFNYKGIDSDDDDDDDEEEEEEKEDNDGKDDDDNDDEEEYHDTGLAKKIARQQKYLKEKMGGVEDEYLDDAEEDEKKSVWSRAKNTYYGVDNDEAQSSDEDVPAEEEQEVIRLQKQRAQSLTAEDYGVQMDDDVSDGEPTLGEMMVKGRTKSSADKDAEGDAVPMYEEVKKDLDAMSKDEQMDAVYRSAPELAGLLAELNAAFNELETQVNPLLAKVKKGENVKKDGKNYFEVKQLLLQAYCQAIVFYLLLKSEGQPVRGHPVLARILEIKSLLDKMKELDQFIPDGLEDVLNEKSDAVVDQKLAAKHLAFSFNSTELHELIASSVEKNDASQETAEPVKTQVKKSQERKRKLQDPPVSLESAKMLQYRAALEEKLKQKTVSGVDTSKTDISKQKLRKSATGKLETTNDFDDDGVPSEGATRDNGTLSSKLSRIIPSKKKKGVSGDDDLPERDDLGERRWKHELRVLSGAGINSNTDGAQLENEPESLSDGGDDVEDEVDESDDDLYNSHKRQRDLKLKMKAEKYSGNRKDVFEADAIVGGKRDISASMEKNKGLTRKRKPQNPRKVKRVKYEKALKRRDGQVLKPKKQTGTYGGEETGINARVTKSIKLSEK